MLILLTSYVKFSEFDNDMTIGTLRTNYPVISEALGTLVDVLKDTLRSDLDRQEMDQYQYAELQRKLDQFLDNIRQYLRLPCGDMLGDGIPCRIRALEALLNRARNPWFLDSPEEVYCTSAFNRFVADLRVERDAQNAAQVATGAHDIPVAAGANFPVPYL
jgi:hypothetical protein